MYLIRDQRRAAALAWRGWWFALYSPQMWFALRPGPWRWLVIPTAALGIWLGVRARRSRIEVGPAGLSIFGTFSTRFIPSDDFAAIEWVRSLTTPIGWICLCVRLTSGRRVTVPAVGPIRWSKTGRAPTAEDAEKLTARVTEHLSAKV